MLRLCGALSRETGFLQHSFVVRKKTRHGAVGVMPVPGCPTLMGEFNRCPTQGGCLDAVVVADVFRKLGEQLKSARKNVDRMGEGYYAALQYCCGAA